MSQKQRHAQRVVTPQQLGGGHTAGLVAVRHQLLATGTEQTAGGREGGGEGGGGGRGGEGRRDTTAAALDAPRTKVLTDPSTIKAIVSLL